LKCAFASPDFSIDPGQGIPDRFNGLVLPTKDCFTTDIGFTAGKDTYILVAPVPGYAYFRLETDLGTAPLGNFVGVPYPTYDTNYGLTQSNVGGASAIMNFSKFRYASLAAGIYPTSNNMQFSGGISVWKIDMSLDTILQPVTFTDLSAVTQYTGGQIKVINGLQGVVGSPPRDNFSTSFINGMFTYAVDRTGAFEWSDYVVGQTQYNDNVLNSAATRSLFYDGTRPLPGLGTTNTIVIKISTPAGAVNSAFLKVWSCLENQPQTSSALYQFANESPPHDPFALEVYSRVKNVLPVAVVAADNAKFWQNVVNMFRQITGAASILPGSIGQIARGMHMLSTAF
jgi:hypothetical protein